MTNKSLSKNYRLYGYIEECHLEQNSILSDIYKNKGYVFSKSYIVNKIIQRWVKYKRQTEPEFEANPVNSKEETFTEYLETRLIFLHHRAYLSEIDITTFKT